MGEAAAVPWTVRERVCAVTGASAGIGKEVARRLAAEGARVVVVSHSQARAQAAVDEIVKSTLNPHVDLVLADLSTHDGVRSAAAEIDRRYGQLHVLVNNAGLLIGKRRLTPDGLEATFALNHLAYFHLTALLLDKVKASAPARIINTSSMAHVWGRFSPQDLQREGRYGQWRAYADSKLCNLLFTFELARRLDGTGVTANAVHPGFVRSHFGSTASPAMRLGIWLARPASLSVPKGAATTVWAATAPGLSTVTGKYFARCAEAEPAEGARDLAAQRKLWALSHRLAGVGG